MAWLTIISKGVNMANSLDIIEGSLELENKSMHPLISWRSVVAGLLVAFFFMVGLLGLGMVFGGIGMQDGTTARGAGLFSGLWFLVSALISLFAGSYFAARISKFQLGRVGSAQGLVIAALFLGAFLYETITVIGGVGQLAGAFLGKTVNIVEDSPVVKNVAQEIVGDLKLKDPPQTVATGIASRLIKGDAQGAKVYLAGEAGITEAQADQRISAAKKTIDLALVKTRIGAAKALKSAGWSLFFLVFLGSVSAVLGGSLGSVANYRKPLAPREFFARELEA
jgi:hypothetical protein